MLDKKGTGSAALFGQSTNPETYYALSDGQLLEKFIHCHDGEAFAEVVRRHGPMVLGVCQRVLRHNQDAEDAFQATFLVLAEKAQRLRRPELLANWLYGVAYRTALHARQRSTRRREHERKAASMCAAKSEPEIGSEELQRLLDEELSRLPEKYRTPLVLCYLEGKTNEEAARLLGWRVGSMSYRLGRSRKLLRKRLEARLSTLSCIWTTIALGEHLQPAIVSPWLAATTVHAAVIVVGAKTMAAVGGGIVSASVRELAEAALGSKVPSRWNWWLLVFLLLIVLFGGGVAVFKIAESLFFSGGRPRCLAP
jgi:RNA polymerase sigma factor (sigma-70 family)